MKHLLVAILCLLTASTICTAAENSCSATYKNEWKKQSKIVDIESRFQKQMTSELREISASAKKTSDISQFMAGFSSLTLPMGISSAAFAVQFARLASQSPKLSKISIKAVDALLKDPKNMTNFSLAMTSPTLIGGGILINLSATNAIEAKKKMKELPSLDVLRGLDQFVAAEKVIQEERDKVDLSYSKIVDGLTLGTKSRDAMKKLYELSVESERLYELKKQYVETAIAAYREKCSKKQSSEGIDSDDLGAGENSSVE